MTGQYAIASFPQSKTHIFVPQEILLYTIQSLVIESA